MPTKYPQQVLILVSFSNQPKKFSNIWDTSVIKFLAKNFKKLPNLVTLTAVKSGSVRMDIHEEDLCNCVN